MVAGALQKCILFLLDLENGGLKEPSKNMREKKKNMTKLNDNAWFSKHFLFKTNYNQEGFSCP